MEWFNGVAHKSGLFNTLVVKAKMDKFNWEI